LFDHVLVGGNLLLVDVVDEGLSLVDVDHHDLLPKLWWHCVNGRGHRLQNEWCMKLVDEDSDRYLRVSRTKLRQDVRCNIVVVDDVVELETVELVLELANFQTVGVHVLLDVVPRLVDLIDDHYGIATDQ
jgi:hypothetical protein